MCAYKLWVMGDIHGSYIPIENFWRRNNSIKTKRNQKNNILILLGDFGGNYYLDKRDNRFKEKLNNYGFIYFVIRGNHEQRPSICASKNPDLWHTEIFFNNIVYVENDYPYIKYALDKPALYQINNYKTLIIPGAYSVDKQYRLEKGWNWFENEQLSSEEMDIGRRITETNNTIDLVLSHTCPMSYEPKDLFLSTIDQSTIDKTMEMYLGEIEYKLNYTLWLWGHYHAYRIYYRDYKIKCIMLNSQKVINIDECINNSSKIIKTY